MKQILIAMSTLIATPIVTQILILILIAISIAMPTAVTMTMTRIAWSQRTTRMGSLISVEQSRNEYDNHSH